MVDGLNSRPSFPGDMVLCSWTRNFLGVKEAVLVPVRVFGLRGSTVPTPLSSF